MLYHLFEYLKSQYHIPGAGLFQYISFRAGVAIVLSLLISIVLGGRIINWLRHLQIGETVRDLGLAGEKQKSGTPTMGGIIIILATIVPCLLLARLDNIYIILMLFSVIWLSIIGFADDGTILISGPGTLFTKQLKQIPSFLRNFLTFVVWLYAGQIIVSVHHLKPLLMDLKCYYHKFALNIC